MALPANITDHFWAFAYRRMARFYLRYIPVPAAPPLSGDVGDTILSRFHFTNVFRATDRVSQYLIKNVIYEDGFSAINSVIKPNRDPENTFFRTVLFKLFNSPETWDHFTGYFGHIRRSHWNLERWIKALPPKPFRGAYMNALPGDVTGYPRPTGQGAAAIRALQMVDWLVQHETWKEALADHPMKVYDALTECPNIGDFLGYQLVTDLGYGLGYEEGQIMIPGPGARSGARFYDPHEDPSNTIWWCWGNQVHELARIGLPPITLYGRGMRPIDVQNVFCEFSKYVGIRWGVDPKGNPYPAGKQRRRRIYRQAEEPPPLFFPDHWRATMLAPPPTNDELQRGLATLAQQGL